MDHFIGSNQNVQWDSFFKNYVNNKTNGSKSTKIAQPSQQMAKKVNSFKEMKKKSSTTAMKRIGELINKKTTKSKNCPIKRVANAQKSQSAKNRVRVNKTVNNKTLKNKTVINKKKNGGQRRTVNKISNFLS